MKKVLTLVLALVMCLALTMSAAAAPISFVSSPSSNPAPTLVEGVNEDEDCEAKLVITSYSDRDTLPADKRELMEKVYDMIVGEENAGELNAAVETLANSKDVPVGSLAVSDLFDIDHHNCEDHEDHGFFKIKFKAESLKNFVGLLHYTGNKWELVEGAKVDNNGYLTFRVEDFSPFAIVVNTGVDAGDNQTGEKFPWGYVVAMAVAAVGFGVVLFVYKKKKA